MSLTLSPLAPGGVFRDFESDVLDRLKAHAARMHGCPVEAVECASDGGVRIWFSGIRDGLRWRGALRFNFPFLRDRKWLGDPVAVSETALKLLGGISTPYPLIERTS